MQLKAAILLVASHCVGAFASQVTPIQKVIQLMTEMKVKGEEEKHVEAVAFSAFAQWCKDTQAEKTEAIKQGADAIMQLEADIGKAEADGAKLGSEIDELDGDLDGWNGEMAAAKAHRKKEEDTYKAAHEDLSESVYAIAEAIKVLKQRSGDVKQTKEETDNVLLQRVAELPRMPSTARGVLSAFLERTSEGSSSAPELNAYEFQSGSVVGMLKELKAEFDDERLALEKDEISRREAHDLQMQYTADNVRQAEPQRARKATKKGERAQDAAQGKADLATTQRVKNDDEVFLQDTVVTCKQAGADYEQRQQLRQEELEAIQKAIEIISSGDVSYASEKHLPQLIQGVRLTSLAQLRSSTAPSRIGVKAADFFLQRATTAKSQMLAELSAQVTKGDPEVIRMIEDLIAKGIDDLAAMATHKVWCDSELVTNKQTREDKSQAVEDLTAKIEELTALEGKLREEIEDLHDAVGVLTEEMKERTKQREEEKAENTATIQEAEAAKTAVEAATKVLAVFYAKASTATALLEQPGQTASQAAGKVYNKPYKGLAGASGGVMGMLEVITSDFARLLAETKSAESTALREYKAFMYAAEKDKAAKEKDARQHGFELTRAKHAIKQNTKELEGRQSMLDAALAYFDKLRPSCANPTETYEERRAKRDEEIQSLKEGLAILQQKDMA